MNGKTFVLYTTEEGGLFRVCAADKEQFLAAVASGQWDETPGWSDKPRGTDMVDLAAIVFLRAEDNFDFILGGSRDEPETWREKFRASA